MQRHSRDISASYSASVNNNYHEQLFRLFIYHEKNSFRFSRRVVSVFYSRFVAHKPEIKNQNNIFV